MRASRAHTSLPRQPLPVNVAGVGAVELLTPTWFAEKVGLTISLAEHVAVPLDELAAQVVVVRPVVGEMSEQRV